MNNCETCRKKTPCDQCRRLLCHCDPNRDEFDRKPDSIEGHYNVGNEVLCIECYPQPPRKEDNFEMPTIFLWNWATSYGQNNHRKMIWWMNAKLVGLKEVVVYAKNNFVLLTRIVISVQMNHMKLMDVTIHIKKYYV